MEDSKLNVQKFVEFKNKTISNISKVIIGKEETIELIIVSLLSGGHVLLEDIPGMGKTMMVKAFAKTLNLPFNRIQSTPDLLPSDITGINFYNQKIGDFEFKTGPIFSNIILIDEINRATPRTQSSLLEAMEERQITADGVTRKLDNPFMVLATQNPIESYGTFPLPEAQLDRFFMRIKMGYPTKKEEKEIILKNIYDPLNSIEPIVGIDELEELLIEVKEVKANDDVLNYLIDIINETRRGDLELGVSPRGSIALFKASQAYALINGRDFIIPEDIKKMAPYILNHRIIARGNNSVDDTMGIINQAVNSVKVPLEEI